MNDFDLERFRQVRQIDPAHHNATWPALELYKLYERRGDREKAGIWIERVPEKYRNKPEAGQGSDRGSDQGNR